MKIAQRWGDLELLANDYHIHFGRISFGGSLGFAAAGKP